MPAASPEVPTASAGDEPLLSYHRDSAPQESTRVASSVSAGATSGGGEAANPLRPQPAAPLPQPQSVAAEAAPPFTVGGLAPATPLATPFQSAAFPASLVAQAPVVEPAIPSPSFPVAPLLRYDAAVQPAQHQAETTGALAAPPEVKSFQPPTEDAGESTDSFSRRLAPPSAESLTLEPPDTTQSKSGALPLAFSKFESFSTAGAGLAIVVGLFLICMWMLRRGGAKPSGVLPAEAFAVLGRAPLTPQTSAQLLRVGNKLVLVAMSSGVIQPLSEVTDPVEVDRLTALCASGRGHGPAAEFQQVLAQLSREPARGFLGGEATPSAGRRSYAA
jgi:flagellar biogenesis protein FliO